MLATVAFLAFWIVLGVVLFFIAVRGGPRGARDALQTQSRGGRRTAGWLFAVFYVAIGVAVPVALLLGNHDDADARVGGSTVVLTAQEETGREIFGVSCANCHTLAGAEAVGKVGPNLDQLKPPEALVLDAVERGRQRGSGTMPADVVQGDDAIAVSKFVAAVAGR
jgi:mono/diheme cytochrome c family protein